MALIKQLVDPEVRERVYDLKDKLKVQQVLGRDPMAMNRTQFESYMEAKATAVIIEAIQDGCTTDDAYQRAHLVLWSLDKNWREEAKRLASNHTS
jgi:hypothetical protein